MANFFKQYSNAYRKKHAGEKIEIDFTTPNNAGVTVPDPKTLGNKKKPQGKFVKKEEG